MATKADIAKNLDAVTGQISTLARTVAIGMLALAWGLIISDSPSAQKLAVALNPWLLLVGLCSIVVLFFDFLQYFFGYISTKQAFDRAEASPNGEAQYDAASSAWRLRLFFFRGKQWLLIATVMLFLFRFAGWAVSR